LAKPLSASRCRATPHFVSRYLHLIRQALCKTSAPEKSVFDAAFTPRDGAKLRIPELVGAIYSERDAIATHFWTRGTLPIAETALPWLPGRTDRLRSLAA